MSHARPVNKHLAAAASLVIGAGALAWMLQGRAPSAGAGGSQEAPIRNGREALEEGEEEGKTPNDWFFAQRAYPYADIPEPAGREAFREAATFARLHADRRGPGSWVAAGPTNVGGRITDIEADPSNPALVYAASAAGGVFRSSDGGLTWTPLFDGQSNLSIGAIALDPASASVVYAGTGEANAAVDNYPGNGVYRTTDGGTSWTHLGLEATGSIGDVEIDPTNPSRVFVAAAGRLFSTGPDRGLYRSLDAGGSWERVLFVNDSTGVVSVEIDPVDPNIVMAAAWERVRRPHYRRVGGPGSGIFRSSDGGTNWVRLGNGLPPQGPTIGRIGIAIARSQPSTAYAIYADDPGNFMGVYKTLDSGASWQRVNDGALSQLTGGFGWYFGQIRVAPSDPNRVFVTGVPMYRTTNGGSSWSEVGSSMHVDHHALWIHPTDVNRLYAGNDGGFYRSTNGTTWIQSGDLPVSQFYAITVDALLPHRLYGGTQDNSTLRTLDGNPDDWDVIYFGDGFYTLVDPLNSNVIYAEYQYGGLGKSTDGGSSWNDVTSGISGSDRHNWSTPVVMDPSNHNVLYYGTQRVYRSTNGASSWSAISPDLTGGDPPGGLVVGTLTTIDVAPSNPSAILAGADDGRVSISVNGGSSWSNVSALLPDRWVTRVSFDPHDHHIAYVTISGFKIDEPLPHVFRTTNAGATWVSIAANLPPVPLNDVIVDPENSSVLYVASDAGVYWSSDTGASWSPLGTGLPPIPVSDLHLDAGSRKLVAGTHGRSMYTFDLGAITVSVPAHDAGPSPVVRVSPNPFATRVTFAMDRPHGARDAVAVVEVFDLEGRLVRRLEPENAAGETARFGWDARAATGRPAADGAYFYRASWGAATRVGKVLLRR